jgi:hypothetical protein
MGLRPTHRHENRGDFVRASRIPRIAEGRLKPRRVPSSVSLLHASNDYGVGIGFDQQNFLSAVDDHEIEIQRARW